MKNETQVCKNASINKQNNKQKQTKNENMSNGCEKR